MENMALKEESKQREIWSMLAQEDAIVNWTQICSVYQPEMAHRQDSLAKNAFLMMVLYNIRHFTPFSSETDLA